MSTPNANEISSEASRAAEDVTLFSAGYFGRSPDTKYLPVVRRTIQDAITAAAAEKDKRIAELEADIQWRKQHMAESDRELLQLQDWLIGNAEWNKDGTARTSTDIAQLLQERIRDLIAKEGEYGDLKAHHDACRAFLNCPADDVLLESIKLLHAHAERMADALEKHILHPSWHHGTCGSPEALRTYRADFPKKGDA